MSGSQFADKDAFSKIEGTRYATESKLIVKFWEELDENPDKVHFGFKAVSKCLKRNNIDCFLVSDAKLRSSDVLERAKFIKMMDSVRRINGCRYYIFSSLHESGESLDSLGGVACFSKW